MIRPWLRSLGLGRLVYLVWHHPKGRLQQMARQGFLNAWRTGRARERMKHATRDLRLPPLPSAPFTTPVCFLTGSRYWEQTAFCLHTLQVQLGLQLPTLIIDDGTLGPEESATLARIAPSLRIISEAACAERLAGRLKPGRYPALHRLWHQYKHIRKVIDPHLLGEAAVLVLDSDMLFKRVPEELGRWLEAPGAPLVMRDCTESYGYTRDQLRAVCGHLVPEKINVGVTGLRSDQIDWDQVEAWCGALLAAHGPSYFLEQALVAMLIAPAAHQVLPPERYVVVADGASAREAEGHAALVHYVADSKDFYFQHAWSG